MSTETTHLELVKWDGTDAFDGPTLASNWDKVDAHPGIHVCTTATRPSAPWDGQVIFDTDLPSYLSWDGTSWVPPEILKPACVLVRSGNQSIANDTDDNVEFTVEERVTWGMADIGTDDESMSIAVTTDYNLSAGAHWLEGNNAGYRYAAIILNGTDVLVEDTRVPVDGRPTALSLSRTVRLATGDALSLRVRHLDGGPLSVGSATPAVKSTFLSAVMA